MSNIFNNTVQNANHDYDPRYSRLSDPTMDRLIEENKQLEEKKKQLAEQEKNATKEQKKLIAIEERAILEKEKIINELIENRRGTLINENNKLFVDSRKKILLDARKKRDAMYDIWKNRMVMHIKNSNNKFQ